MFAKQPQNARSFDIKSEAFMRDPAPTLRDMRAAGDVIELKLPLIGAVWAATTHASASEMLKRNDVFVQDPKKAGKKSIPGLQWWVPQSFRVLAQNMLQTDEPNHRRLRSLVDQAFHRRGIAEMRPSIEKIATSLIDDLPKDRPFDFIQDFARPFPLAVISELLGLPDHDRAQFMRWCAPLTHATSPLGLFRALPGIRKLLRYLKGKFKEAEHHPTPGLISELVKTEIDGHKLSEDELLSMVFLLLLAGHETTTHLLSGGLVALLTHPDQKQRMLNEWDRINLVVEELLRFVSPVQMTKPRFVAEDTTLAGHDLKRGALIISFLASANTDPTVFEEPDTLDVFRQPNKHLSFGSGIHVCLGIQLARAEMDIALKQLFTRHPDLQLACLPSDLRWQGRIGLRSLKEMPLILEPESPV